MLGFAGGSQTYYRLNPQTPGLNIPFNGTNIGTFATAGSGGILTFAGGQIKTFKNGTCPGNGTNVLNGKIDYRVYLTSAGPGAMPFTQLNLPFDANLANPGDQRWNNNANTTNILTGLVSGNYTIEVYTESDYDGCGTGTNFFSDGGNNYKATFSVSSLCGSVYTIDNTLPASATNYVSFTSAISALNSFGVTCATVFNVKAGTTYTERVSLNQISGATATNTVTFVKSGAGANPVINAPTGAASTTVDAIFSLNAADFVTIDGIDLTDPATNNSQLLQSEMGYALWRTGSAGTANGCQSNTIRNCVVTLQKPYNTAGVSTGIYGANSTNASLTALTGGSLTVTAPSSSNTFTNNTIQNSSQGIVLLGIPDVTPFTFYDQNNNIGGNTAGTPGFGGTGSGNLIRNINVLTTTSTVNIFCIEGDFQNGLLIRRNTVDNAATGGGAGSAALRQLNGVFVNNGATGATVTATISNNIFTLASSASSNSEIRGVRSALGSGATVTIDNNAFTVTIPAGSSSSSIYLIGVSNSSIGSKHAALNITNNNWNNTGLTLATTGAIDFGALNSDTDNLTFTGNTVQNVTRTGSSGAFRGYFNNGSSAAAGIQNISTNTIIDISQASSTGTLSGIVNTNGFTGVNPQVLVSGNIINGLTGTSGNVIAIDYDRSNATVGPTVGVTGNFVGTAAKPITGTGTVYGIRLGSSNLTLAVTGNTVNGVSSTTASASVYGIRSEGNSGSMTVSQNTVSNVSVSGSGGSVYGIGFTSGATNNITRNKVFGISHTGTGGTAVGIYSIGGVTYNVSNNLVGGITAPNSISPATLAGINLSSGTTANVYYNTVVLLAGTSTGSGFGSAAVQVTTGANLDLRNNIIVNLQTPTGSGRAIAFRRGGANTAANFAATSNNNLFYAGTPTATNVIFFDGTTGYPTLGEYQTLVGALAGGTRESSSVTDNPTFVSTTGSSSDFLRLSPTVATKAESGAVAVTGVTDEYDNTNVRTGYPQANTNGGGTAPDIGAYEDDMTPVATDLQALAFTTPATTGCISTATQTVTVRIKNVGTTTINFVTTPLSVSGTGTNPAAVVTPFGPVAVNTGTLAPNGTRDVVLSTTYDMSTVGSYSFSSSFTGGGDGYAPNNSITTTRTVANPVAGVITSSVSTFCGSTPANLTLTLTGSANGDVQFEQSIDGGANWTAVGTPQPTAATVTQAATAVQTTRYRAVVSCGALPSANTSQISVTDTRPGQSIVAPTATCDGDAFNIVVTGSNAVGTVSGSNSTPSAITDNTTLAGASSTITLAGAGAGTVSASSRIRVTVNITHTFDADVDLFLVGPGGTGAMLLSSDNGSSDDNYVNTVFDTNASNIIGTTGNNAGPFTGTYRAEGTITTAPDRTGAAANGTPANTYNAVIPAGALNGVAIDGTWTLRAFDDLSGDVGTLNNWSLEITDAAIPAYTHAISGPGTVSAVTYSGATNNIGTVTVTGAPTGTNTYTIVTTNTSGCARTSTRNVIVNPRPTASFDATTTPVCAGTSQTLTGTLTGTAPFTGSYTVNGGAPQALSTSGNTFSIATGALATTSTYNITVLSDANCTATALPAATTTITVNPRPTVAFDPVTSPACVGSSQNVTGTFTGTGPFTGTYTVNGGAPQALSVTGSTFSIPTGTLTINVTYAITAVNDVNCAATAFPSDVTIVVTSTTTWTGTVSSNWYTVGNWTACVPSATISAIIPTGTPNQPVIASGTAEVDDLTIQGAAVLTQNGTGNLEINGIFTTASVGSFVATTGTTRFLDTTPNQPIPAATYHDVTVGGPAAKVLTGSPLVGGVLDLSGGSITLGTFDLTMNDPAAGPLTSITGADATHYLITTSTGRLIFTRTGNNPTAHVSVTFPIGTTVSYTPAVMTFSTNVSYVNAARARVSDASPTPTRAVPNAADHVVEKTWDVSWGGGTLPGAAVASLQLQWNTTDEGSLFDRTKSRIVHFNGTQWDGQPFGPTAGYQPAVLVAGRWARTRDSLTTFSPFALEDFAHPLPVELVRFDATRQEQNTLLTWTTASEKDSRGFDVQVSTNGKNYRTLRFVASETPNSTTLRTYSFVDRETGKKGVRYYRLVQVDLNGATSPSAVRTVTFDGKVTTMVAALPNPFTDQLSVEVDAATAGAAQLLIIDALGRTVMTQSLPVTVGHNVLTPALPVALPVGTYTLVTVVDGQRFRSHLLKQ